MIVCISYYCICVWWIHGSNTLQSLLVAHHFAKYHTEVLPVNFYFFNKDRKEWLQSPKPFCFSISQWLERAYCTVCIYSWNRLAPSVGSPVTHVTCQSSVLEPTLTAPPTFICMTGTPATTSKATATMASARLMNSNASPCGVQVNQLLVITLDCFHFFPSLLKFFFFDNVFVCCFLLCLCVQEQNQPLGYALNELTLQEIHMGTVERTARAPLPNVMWGKTQQLH